MDIDLDIQNYSLQDICDLFSIPPNFNKEQLKSCKKQVLKMHPDKSKLDKSYFIFFSKAYKLIYSIYEFKHKNQTACPTKYTDIMNEGDTAAKAQLIQSFTNNEDFLNHFNQAFEKNNLVSNFEKGGYGNWLISDEDLMDDFSNVPMNERNRVVESYKDRQIKIREDIREVENTHFAEITGAAPDNYSSDIFSKMPYEDIKKAHTETLIPVSSKDMPKNRYKTTEELRRVRGAQIAIPSVRESNKILSTNKAADDTLATYRAYQLAQQSEAATVANDKFNLMFKQLTHV
jgi:hypothetical protein